MASNAPKLAGYDYEFVEPPPNDLICLICTFVAKDPQQLTCCGKIYCQVCLKEQKKRSQTNKDRCPQCREDNAASFTDKMNNRRIQALEVKCTNAKIGCEWIGELGALDDHYDKCMFVLIECENECTDIQGEVIRILRKNSEKHLSSECPNRIVKCELCEEEGEHEYVTGEHCTVCPEVVALCSNEGCDVEMKQCEIKEHHEICPHEEIACKYSNIGCKLTLPRKDLTEHEANAQSHLDIALNTVGSLMRKVESLEQTAQKPVQFTFKVTNFENCKDNNRDIYSPSFYTSPGGYKICLHVYTNGHGNRIGTHVSAFFNLMKGENDHQLPWPFRPATFTIEVLNQLSDSSHCKTTVEYRSDLNDKNNQRVMVGERRSSGKGNSRLIDHASLLDRQPNCQYCVDDTVYFRVTVHEAPTPKAWLVCNI